MGIGVSEDYSELQKLIRLWKENYKSRAMGGWWALAGFSLQMSTFLLKFFTGIKEGNIEHGLLAETN